ncbi:MAG: hypothetical protein ACP5HM_10465 [Anaerolineae bacterium]
MKTRDRIYLLYLSPIQRNGLRRFRVTLNDARTRKRQDFADLEQLMKFLKQEEAQLVGGAEVGE